MNFNAQMEFVKERNRIKYESKLMKEEDEHCNLIQSKFKQEKEQELLKKLQQAEMEELRQIERMILEEEAKEEEKRMNRFVQEYVLKKLNSSKKINSNLILSDIENEAINIYYERKLIDQQNKEYELACEMDRQRFG